MTRFVGSLLITLGVLLAGTTGLCTGVVIVFALPGLFQEPEAVLSASPLLLVGIVPCICGVFLARAGLKVFRSADHDEPFS